MNDNLVIFFFKIMADAKQFNIDPNDDYDDKDIILLDQSNSNSSKDIAQPSPHLRGMDLDLSFAAAESKDNNQIDNDCIRIQEEQINVVFELPDGSQGENAFKLGQTVEVLKSYIESEYGIPMMEQELYFGDGEKLLQNPFSLLDYPEAKGQTYYYIKS